ncbi:hypothetical protein FOA43_000616 [Brettanomyces nanus]|uniref:Bromo domain-containing protein n=1 Tax=Eeniella nana TaxID=13502 RepID=A0A875RWM7_EENNA|nr:uncharacterized protein FOA43_000616 [Brettanomyces nanus]QPG73306.1 hypothetical protein FOA43_000616 [Brettanomyces nanus]
MPKRKHPSVTLTIHRHAKGEDIDELPEVETLIGSDDTFSKKKLQEFIFGLVAEAINLKDDITGEYIAGPFVKLPSKKLFPDYYDIIPHPISLNEIKIKANLRKTRVADYPSLYEFVQMFKLMSDNAATYNGADSVIAKDANHIFEFAKDKCEEFFKKSSTDDIDSEEVTGTDMDISFVKNEPKADETTTLTPTDTVLAVEREPTSDETDYSTELYKIMKSVINFKSSHHKNSTRLSLPFIEPVDARSYPDYHTIVKKGMCFNDVEDNLAKGEYSSGKEAAQRFLNDVNLIFSNACEYNAANSAIYRDALSLKNFFNRRMTKFTAQTQAIKKRGRGRPPIFATEPRVEDTTKISSVVAALPEVRRVPKRRGRKPKRQKPWESLNAGDNDDQSISATDSGLVGASDAAPLNTIAATTIGNTEDWSAAPTTAALDVPGFIRKHDVEKAEDFSAVDDITAFIKRFTFSSAIKQYSTYTSDVMQYFEHCMIEPAGNSTIGGSTYSIILPAEEILGQPLIVLVSLQNRIIDEKYTTELKVNKEILKPQPLTISYDEEDEDGEFVACKFEFKLGLGLNLFEFQLKVPFPLKESKIEREKAHDPTRVGTETERGRVTRSAARKGGDETTNETPPEDDDDDDSSTEDIRNETQQYFREMVKVWVKIA